MDIQDFTWVRVALAVAVHVILIAVATWDLIALASGRPALTVSALIQAWSIESPALPLAVGFVIGHLFWPVR